MLTILETGIESSGNRALTRLFTKAGAKVLHKPMPMSTHTTDNGVWTDFSTLDWDIAVVIHRDWYCTINAQVEAGHVENLEHAISRSRQAICNIYKQLSQINKPWYTITYESFFNLETIKTFLNLIGLDSNYIENVWHDANAKYYGGPEWGEHRPLWALPMFDNSLGMTREHPDFPKFKTPYRGKQ